MKKLNYAAVAVSVMSVIGTMSLTGCTSEAEVEALRQQVRDLENTVIAVDKNRRVTRESTENYYLDVRRSAAIEKGGFKHTLYNTSNYSSDSYPDNVKYDLNDRYTSESGLVAGNGNGSSLNKGSLFGDSDITRYFKPNGTVSDYSYYHYGRWQRLCNSGKNMDRLDWIFVKKNRNKFPNELVGRCSLPADSVMAKHGFEPLKGTASVTVIVEPLLNSDTSNTVTQSQGNVSLYPANLSEPEVVATPQPRLRETNLKEIKEVQLQRAPKEYIPNELQGRVASKAPTQTQSMSMSNATVTTNPSTPIKPEIRDSLNTRSVEKVVTTKSVTKAPTAKKSEVVGLSALEDELRIDDAEL